MENFLLLNNLFLEMSILHYFGRDESENFEAIWNFASLCSGSFEYHLVVNAW